MIKDFDLTLGAHEQYMRRAFELARLGNGKVSPNPMVGALLVSKGRQIIGEGWHQNYGGPHAEINAFRSVLPQKESLIPESTLYVTLEPCCIFGRTPPCTAAILERGVRRVVISAIDETDGVAGRGVKILRDRGVEVVTGVLETEGKKLAAIRNTFVSKGRPFVLLKYAQSRDGFLAGECGAVTLSNAFNKTLVHRWRSQVDAILVGTETARLDNPRLNVRVGQGKHPVRVVLDRTGRLDHNLRVFDGNQKTIVISERTKDHFPPSVEVITTSFSNRDPQPWLKELSDRRITSLMVEGGAQLLNSFFKYQCWDRAALTTGSVDLGAGVLAPQVPGCLVHTQRMGDNVSRIYEPLAR